MQLTNRRFYIVEQHDMEHNHTNAHLSFKHKISSKYDDGNYAYLFHKDFYPLKQITGFLCLKLVFSDVILQFRLFFPFNFFSIKRFDNCDRLNDIDNSLIFGFPKITHSSAPSTENISLFGGNKVINRNDSQSHHANPNTCIKHQNQS